MQGYHLIRVDARNVVDVEVSVLFLKKPLAWNRPSIPFDQFGGYEINARLCRMIHAYRAPNRQGRRPSVKQGISEVMNESTKFFIDDVRTNLHLIGSLQRSP